MQTPVPHVYKTILPNGMTVLIMPRHHVPKVSIQLWYNVGSKDEKTGEKGIAHLIEHMIFKGTDTLSESDINMITYKLSGYCNAFTSFDYTGYMFDMPSQNWLEVLPIMADCMRNCTFKQELLNSELKAVIQELKMYNDDYQSTLVEKMIAAIFPDHPYHNPVIGYKHDLWSLDRDALVRFYERHYVPNNATLVIVGDVELEEALQKVEEAFGHIAPNLEYAKQEFYYSPDLGHQNVTLYRDIQQPFVILAWTIPGTTAGLDYVFDLISWIVGAGKGSRLYKKLVDELDLCTDIESFVYDLFEYGLFFVYFQPKDAADREKIIAIIAQEFEFLASELVTDQELVRARKKTEVDFISLAENNQKQAYLLGKLYLATGSELALANYCAYPHENLKDDIASLVKTYLRPAVMHRGQVLPLADTERDFWQIVQQRSDEEDARVLGNVTREIPVEEMLHGHTIVPKPPKPFTFPTYEECILSNGLKVLYCHNQEIPKIELVLDLKSKYYYESTDAAGMSMCVADLLQEGTEKHTGQELAQLIESYGMDMSAFPGQISMGMLSSDLHKGLSFLHEIITEAKVAPDAVERVKDRLLIEIKNFWDTPSQFAGQLMRQELYKNHPYSKNILGTEKTVSGLTRDMIFEQYKSTITPHGARLALVGDLRGINVPQLLEDILGSWGGPEVADIVYPEIMPIHAHTVDYTINRDQTVLAFGGISVSRYDADFDKLLLFDQVFTGGVLGSMSSRLFALREQSGLFYTIGGSLLAGSEKQPGIAFVKTIVSNDRLVQAEQQIRAVIEEGATQLTDTELFEAQQALINSMVDLFASNRQMANSFLFLDSFSFAKNYFDTRSQQLLAVTPQEIKQSVARILDSKKMVTVRIGRI